MKEAIAILTGGGPAPGMNTVVGSVAKTFLHHGYKVIGLHEGYTGLFNPTPRTVEIDFAMADAIFNQGGSFLQMSRFKPKDSDFENNFNLKFFTDNNIKLLVTVGGDDTASTANRIAKFLEAKQYPIANIHVPKTIDNDLPLPKGAPTFGYESAKDKGAVIARAVYVDARTSGNWFVLAAMGRSAGHLAFGIGEACHYPMIVIPEMFDKTEITVEKIVNLVISAILKRKLMGMDYGAAVISEGVFHSLSDEEIAKSGTLHGSLNRVTFHQAQIYHSLCYFCKYEFMYFTILYTGAKILRCSEMSTAQNIAHHALLFSKITADRHCCCKVTGIVHSVLTARIEQQHLPLSQRLCAVRVVMQRLAIDCCDNWEREVEIMFLCFGLNNCYNFGLGCAGTNSPHCSTMHIYRHVYSLFYLCNFLLALVVTLSNYSLHKLHRGLYILLRWVYSKQFLQPHSVFTAIGRQEMYFLSFCLSILYICGKVAHRTCHFNTHTLAFLLYGRLHAGPYNIVYCKFVAKDYLFVVVYIYNGGKPFVIRREIVEEC